MTISEFRRVRERLQPHVRTTPIVPSDIPDLFLKLENLQHTHSFKLRGAFARITEIAEARDTRTILTVSAGNHGVAVARAASTFNLRCTIIVPLTAPKTKIEAIRKYGVDLQIHGANYDEAEAHALRMSENTTDYVFVSPYNDRFVILGQGSVAFEILEQLPNTGVIVVPIGGGGLAAGVSTAAKALGRPLRVVGVQTEASAAIYHSLKAGHMVTVPDLPSIADGIAGNIDPATVTFPIIQKNVDDVVLVSEAEIKEALHHLFHIEKLVVEGSAAAAVAAVMTGKIRPNGPVVAVITGGNIDLPMLKF